MISMHLVSIAQYHISSILSRSLSNIRVSSIMSQFSKLETVLQSVAPKNLQHQNYKTSILQNSRGSVLRLPLMLGKIMCSTCMIRGYHPPNAKTSELRLPLTSGETIRMACTKTGYQIPNVKGNALRLPLISGKTTRMACTTTGYQIPEETPSRCH